MPLPPGQRASCGRTPPRSSASPSRTQAAPTASGSAEPLRTPMAHVANGRVAVQQHGRRGGEHQRAGGALRGGGVVERRQRGQRDRGPAEHQQQHGAAQRGRVTHDPRAALAAERRRRAAASSRRQQQPDRRGHHEALVRRVEQHTGGRQRVQPEEAGRRQQRHRDQLQPGVGAPARGRADGERQGRARERGCQHQPEVRRVVLPGDVRGRAGHQQPEAEQRRREQRDQARGRRAARSAIARAPDPLLVERPQPWPLHPALVAVRDRQPPVAAERLAWRS